MTLNVLINGQHIYVSVFKLIPWHCGLLKLTSSKYKNMLFYMAAADGQPT